MKKILLFIICLISVACANAQTPTLQWVKAMGGIARDHGNSIVIDVVGNVYTTGFFEGTVDFDPGPGTFNLTAAPQGNTFISKLDASGNFIWAKNMGGTISNTIGASIALDGAGNVFVTGSFGDISDFDPGTGIFNLTSSGDEDIFILKLDNFGNFVWAKQIGGISVDDGYSIAVDAQGYVYTLGIFNGTVDFDPGAGTFNLTSFSTIGSDYSDIFISKLDNYGNFIWAKQMGGTGATDNEGFAIATDALGNVYSSGLYEGTVDFNPGAGTANLTASGLFDIFISKLDASGNFLWAKSIGETMDNEGYAVAIDLSGNVYTTGFFEATADFDPGAGTFNLTCPPGSQDVFISKLDALGNFVWAKSMGVSATAAESSASSIAIDTAGNVYITGEYQGTVDFDPGIGNDSLTSSGIVDVFISKLDSSGNFVWAKSMGGAGSVAWGHAIAVDVFGNVYTTGYFSETTDFDPGVGIYNLTSAGDDDIFIHKLSQTANDGIKEYTDENNISIYPNPSNGLFNVVLSAPTKNASIEIYNSIGALVYSKQTTNTQTTIELTNQANGLYFVKVMAENKIIGTKKIIKE